MRFKDQRSYQTLEPSTFPFSLVALTLCLLFIELFYTLICLHHTGMPHTLIGVFVFNNNNFVSGCSEKLAVLSSPLSSLWLPISLLKETFILDGASALSGVLSSSR